MDRMCVVMTCASCASVLYTDLLDIAVDKNGSIVHRQGGRPQTCASRHKLVLLTYPPRQSLAIVCISILDFGDLRFYYTCRFYHTCRELVDPLACGHLWTP